MHMNKDGTLDIEGDLRKTIATLEQRVADLEAKLVERDVYEAQQILPPEQAALIKHLATVERCIDNGGVVGDDGDQDCPFCHEYEYEHHLKDCAWLALQFDRKPADTMALVEGWAWEENDRRDRARAMTPRRLLGAEMTMVSLNEMFKATWPAPGSVRVETSPFVPPGTAYLTNLSAFERGAETLGPSKAADASRFYFGPTAPALGDPLDLEALSEHPAVTAVAPPDDEDVP